MLFLSSKTLAKNLEMHMLASYVIVSSSCIITQYLTLDASVERGVIGSSMSTLGNSRERYAEEVKPRALEEEIYILISQPVGHVLISEVASSRKSTFCIPDMCRCRIRYLWS
jgi:hypothetical protein